MWQHFFVFICFCKGTVNGEIRQGIPLKRNIICSSPGTGEMSIIFITQWERNEEREAKGSSDNHSDKLKNSWVPAYILLILKKYVLGNFTWEESG